MDKYGGTRKGMSEKKTRSPSRTVQVGTTEVWIGTVNARTGNGWSRIKGLHERRVYFAERHSVRLLSRVTKQLPRKYGAEQNVPEAGD